MTRKRARQARHDPTNAAELLDHEEARAIRGVSQSVRALGKGLCDPSTYGGTIRESPFLSVGLGASLGLVGGPLLLRGLERALHAASNASSSVLLRSFAMQGIVRTSLSLLRKRA